MVVETIGWDDVPALMTEVRAMAQGLLRLEGNAQSLTPSALVGTALRRQLPAGKSWEEVAWKDRAYFLGAMYQAMRRALVDHARTRNARKREAVRAIQVEDLRLHDLAATAEQHPEQVEALLDALERLRGEHPEYAEVVEHRYFGGYTNEEIARILGSSEKTVRRWYERARVWLHAEVLRILNGEAPEGVP